LAAFVRLGFDWLEETANHINEYEINENTINC
jgi:hypothetical protein